MPQSAQTFANTLPKIHVPISLWAAPDTVAAPSERVVAAVLQFGDLREEHEDGMTLIRFSRHRLEREDMAFLLGEELERALDVSLIWDEAEDQLVRVLDVAPLRQGRGNALRLNRYADAHKRSFPRERLWRTGAVAA
jgi:hypothetical protein